MPPPGEYKTVQARILAYAQEIGWSFVPRDEAEQCRELRPRLTCAVRAAVITSRHGIHGAADAFHRDRSDRFRQGATSANRCANIRACCLSVELGKLSGREQNTRWRGELDDS